MLCSQVIDEEEEVRIACKSAETADVVVLVCGLNSEWESEGASCCRRIHAPSLPRVDDVFSTAGFDRKDMNLPPSFNKLINAVLDVNPRAIIVNQSGTPVEMPWIAKASTVLQAWYGGNELGESLDRLTEDLSELSTESFSCPSRRRSCGHHLRKEQSCRQARPDFPSDRGRLARLPRFPVSPIPKFVLFALFPELTLALSFSQRRERQAVLQRRDLRRLPRVRRVQVRALHLHPSCSTPLMRTLPIGANPSSPSGTASPTPPSQWTPSPSRRQSSFLALPMAQ